jgi:hypothetical protein
MKFNRVQLIERLQQGIAASQANYERQLEEWQHAKEQWEVGTATEQFTLLHKYVLELGAAVNKLQNMSRPLTPEELPERPQMSSGERFRDNHAFNVVVPSRIKGLQEPTAPNIQDVERFIEALRLILDDEVSSSAIETLGHANTLRRWL